MPTVPTPSPIETAVEHHRAGRWVDAERLYHQVLLEEADHPDALHLLGILLSSSRQHEEAVRLVKRSVELRPAVPEYRNGLGNVLLQAGDLPSAAEVFQQALDLRPDYAEAWSNLGNVYKIQGRIDEALVAHAKAVELSSEAPDAWNNYGVSLRLKGRLAEAEAAFKRVIELRPVSAEAHNNLGTVLRNQEKLEPAIAAYTRALELRPDLAEIWTNWGNVQRDAGRLDEAIAAHTRAIQLAPAHANSYSNLAVALTSAGRLSEAVQALRRAVELQPDAADLHSNLIYTLHFLPEYDGQMLLHEHRNWANQFAEPLTVHAPKIKPSAAARLRVGFVSPDLRLHPVGRFLLPLLRAMNRDEVEVLCYSDVRRPDEWTAKIAEHTSGWRSIVGMSDERMASLVRADQIDVLVDLSMHMADNRLLVFARKPAPVQISWLAYAGTTGMTAMDYRISDPYLDPPDEGLPYVEKTLRLPHCFWCYEAPDAAPEINSLPATTAGFVTFGCFNNFCKVTEPTLELWAELMRRIPRSRLLLHSLAGQHQDSVRKLFSAAGVDSDRIKFVGFQPMDEFFRLHHRVDICLDPFPYGGGTTTCDALWMGVPVVTLLGKTAVGRGGSSILNNIGLGELVARTPGEYLAIAESLAGDLPRLSELRASLLERMRSSPLMDGRQFAVDMTALFREACRAL